MRINDSDQVIVLLDSDGSYNTSPTVTYNKRLFDSGNQFIDAEFGHSVAIGRDRLIIGAPATSTTPGWKEGAVFLYNPEVEDSPGPQFKLAGTTTLDGRDNGGRFGVSVAAKNNTLVVGISETGFQDSGAAFVYDLHGSDSDAPSRITELRPPYETGVGANNEFGLNVAIGSGRIAVAAPEDSNGYVYVYDYNGSNIARLYPDAGEVAFGSWTAFSGPAVAIGSGRIVVGCTDAGADPGSAYIYDLNGNRINKVTGIRTVLDGYNQSFGAAVAVGYGRIAVGDPQWDFGGFGPTDAGKAYLYDINGNFIKNLEPSRSASASDNYGESIAIGENCIAVGSPGDSSGYVYLYDLNGNELQQIPSPQFKANRIQPAGFGTSVAIDHGKLLIGHPRYERLTTTFAEQGMAFLYDFNTDRQTHILDLLDDY